MSILERLNEVLDKNKKFILTDKEKSRSEVVKDLDGKELFKYTVIKRKQDNGKILVALINVETGLPLKNFNVQYVNDDVEARKSIKEMLRMLDKLGIGGKMASFSRGRHKN